MVVILPGRVMLLKPVQPENANSPIEVTLSGMEICVSPLQFENALVGTVVIPPGMTKEVRPLQLEKACSPMEVTLFGRVRLVRVWQ